MNWDQSLSAIYINNTGSNWMLLFYAIVSCGLSFYTHKKHKQLKTRQSFGSFLGTLLFLAGVMLISLNHFFLPYWIIHYRIYLLVKLAALCCAFGGGYMVFRNGLPIRRFWHKDATMEKTQSRFGGASLILVGLNGTLMFLEIISKEHALSIPFSVFVILPIAGCLLGILGIREKNRNEYFSMLGTGLNSLILITLLWLYLHKF